MNIDLLPLAAFALESSRGADRFIAEAHTLTLRLTHPTLDSSQPPMAGSVALEAFVPRPEVLLRAAVLPADGLGLSITF